MVKVYSQTEHERINAVSYPGTRQLCSLCNAPTERCEDDSLFYNEDGPLCIDCFKEITND